MANFFFVMQAHNNVKVSLCALRRTTRIKRGRIRFVWPLLHGALRKPAQSRSASSQALVMKLDKYYNKQQT